ncbi:hypothetical protein SNEBB_008700 [Seison nebaliae]|nr:hypothetical protein SNEBB_008700 [Seison nebaliae]
MGNSGGKHQDHRILTDAELEFLEETTKLNKSDILEWHQGFLLDCPSGMLDKKTFVKTYKKLYPSGKPEKFCDYLFRVFDADSSGKIDFGEFLIAVSLTTSGDLRQRLSWSFDMYDIDGNGKIDHREMEKLIEAIYELLGEQHKIKQKGGVQRVVDEIFGIMDTSKDGLLSRDEFIDGLMKDPQLRSLLAPNSQG